MKKICNKCGLEKELDEFVWRNIKKNKKHNICKECQRALSKQNYKNDKVYYKISSKKNTLRIRQLVYDYLKSNPCIDCGETDPIVLEFDHRNPKEKLFDMGQSRLHGINMVEKEIEKCDIRCANCHRKKTAKQFDWYNKLVK